MRSDLTEQYRKFLRIWAEMNRPIPPPLPRVEPEPVDETRMVLDEHLQSNGVSVHGLGTAAVEDVEAFERAGAIQEALSSLPVAEKPPLPTPIEIGADPIGSAARVRVELSKHEADQENPHNVTLEQIGFDPKQFAKAEHYHPQAARSKGGSGGSVLTQEEKALLEYILANGNLPADVYGDELLALIM